MISSKKITGTYLFFNKFIAIIILISSFPFILLICLSIKFTSHGKIIFRQERLGHDCKKFTFYKFRTMIDGADSLKEKYLSLNYAKGPVFKIENDPRFTKIGKFLSESHLDELPQLINVLKGEMLLVGFRPPLNDEVKNYKKRQMLRFEGYPGITSVWAVNGGHKKFSFDAWIYSDIQYEKNRSFLKDFSILIKTFKLFVEYIRYRK
jgi:lipopolysaccharide/colanic/teichoic acid biosynthesis glycosyltransferase